MSTRIGRCTNFGNCSQADSRKPIQLKATRSFECPECRKPLREVTKAAVNPVKASDKQLYIIIAAIFVFALLGIGALVYIKKKTPKVTAVPPPGSVVNSQTLPTPDPSEYKDAQTILTLSGSGTVGGVLTPAIIEGFVRSLGGTSYPKITVKYHEEDFIVAKIPSVNKQQPWVKFVLYTKGTGLGFSQLAKNQADIVMSSRPVNEKELAETAPIGDLKSQGAEHVLALDAVAIITGTGNPVNTITRQQIFDVFTGKITNWKELGGNDSPINVYSRDTQSSTYETFKTFVLGQTPIVPTAQMFEDSTGMSRKVAADASALGFVGLSFAENAKRMAVADTGARPLVPNQLTVGSEDYVFTRRLYYYINPTTTNSWVKQFIEYALSREGQQIVNSQKFSGMTMETMANVQGLDDTVLVTDTPGDYRSYVEQAIRLPINFRFRTGATSLDNKGWRDVGRVADALARPEFAGRVVMLFGFADNVGKEDKNAQLSQERAQSVAEQLKQYGVNVRVIKGYGSRRPIASNEAEDGRERNRRVEVWLGKQ